MSCESVGSNELWAGIDAAFILCFGCVDAGTVNEFGQAFTLHSFHVAACSCNILAPAVGEDATRLQEEIPSRWRRSQGEAARACAEEKPWGPGKAASRPWRSCRRLNADEAACVKTEEGW